MKKKVSKTIATCALALLASSLPLSATEYVTDSMGNPSFSPDGQKIVFESDVFNGYGDILIMDADGTNVTPILSSVETDYYTNPAWSPDGNYIAYDRTKEDETSVWIINADGSNPVQISRGKYNDMEPAWHPDGVHLVISTVRAHGSDLILINTSGEEIRYVSAKKLPEGSPHISPDGQWVVYETLDRRAGPEQDETSILIWKRPLADITVPPTQLTTGLFWDFSPKFSPDGSKIAFSGTRGYGIQVMNSDGTNLHEIAVPGNPSDPNWSPDGSKIVFAMDSPDPTNSERGYPNIYTINSDGTGLTRVTWMVERPTFQPDGGEYGESQTVTISCATPGATIRYTTDGSDPIESSPEYTEPIAVNETSTLKARAWKTDHFPSAINTAEYVMQVATPEFDPDGGTYTGTQSIIIASATSDAVIRYTTDGTDPTETSTEYEYVPVQVTTSLTLKAKAFKTGLADSEIAVTEYVIE